MRPFQVASLLVCLLLTLPARAARKEVSIADVAIVALPGFTQVQGQAPAQAQLVSLWNDPGSAPGRPRAHLKLCYVKGGERACLLYLEYASSGQARGALPGLRARLWGGDIAPPGGPRLLRVMNVVAIIEAQTLGVSLQASRRMAGAGAVQDGADVAPAADPDEGGPEALPAPLQAGPAEPPAPQALDLSTAAAADPQSQAQVMAQMGKHLEASASAGQLLKDKRYAEALLAYRRMKQAVDADPSASELARWDALTGIGLSAAYSNQMQAARDAFEAALGPAGKLDLRKVAETYFNLACAEAELGHKPAALAALKKCLFAARKAGAERLEHYQNSIRTDSSLASLRGDPRLKKILAGR